MAVRAALARAGLAPTWFIANPSHTLRANVACLYREGDDPVGPGVYVYGRDSQRSSTVSRHDDDPPYSDPVEVRIVCSIFRDPLLAPFIQPILPHRMPPEISPEEVLTNRESPAWARTWAFLKLGEAA